MKFYRYTATTGVFSWELSVYYMTYHMIKETPCGYWIGDRVGMTNEDIKNKYVWTRWVSKTAKKRYAYPTKKEALESFLARKYRQAALARDTIEYAESAAYKAEQLMKELDDASTSPR